MTAETDRNSSSEPLVANEPARRGGSIVLVLLVAAGIGRARTRADGRGEDAPVADNLTAAGRAQNRRVEIVVAN